MRAASRGTRNSSCRTKSYIHVVDDPTNGAGGFEALTEDLCARAWEVFQDIEAHGGLAAALATGVFQAQVAQTAGVRAKNVARAKEKLTGTNEFPNIFEAPLDVLAPYDPTRSQAPSSQGAVKSASLVARRLAAPFERLRDLSDAQFARTGARPKVFLATLGAVADFTARANFAKNFFEAGGLETVVGPSTDDAAALVAAFQASGAKTACICSSDAIYCSAAELAARALSGAGAILYLAGRPGQLEPSLRAAGISDFIFAGCDMFDILQRALGGAK